LEKTRRREKEGGQSRKVENARHVVQETSGSLRKRLNFKGVPDMAKGGKGILTNHKGEINSSTLRQVMGKRGESIGGKKRVISNTCGVPASLQMGRPKVQIRD